MMISACSSHRSGGSLKASGVSLVRAILAACLLAPAGTAWAALPLPLISPISNPAPSAGGQFGGAVAGLDDVNGDGVGDLAVGAPGQDVVHLFSGADRSLLRTLNDPEGAGGTKFGSAVIGVPDLDGDGVAEIVVGAPGSFQVVPLPCVDPNTPCPPDPLQGRAFLFSGATGALIRKILPPGNQFLAFGVSLASIGDVSGDGKADIAVGSPTLQNNKFGQVFAFSGATGALLWTSVEPGTETIASLGYTLAAIDDVNADGKNDLLAGAPFHDADADPAKDLLSGRAYLLSGASGSIVRMHDNPSPADGEAFGGGLSGIGDETGDGIDEYMIGDPAAGIVFLYRGGDGSFLRSIASPGNASTDFFGYPIVRVDDMDGDGRDDFWVAASQGGRLYLMNGAGTVLISVMEPTPSMPSPPDPAGGFGRSLAATADFGADGMKDLLAGEPSEPAGGSKAGAAWLVVNDRAPVAVCRPVMRSADASCLATVSPLDVDDGSYDPDGDMLTFTLDPPGPFTLGMTVVTLTVYDGRGASSSCTAAVTVVDDTPPAITGARPSRSTLWPPNHKMIPVRVGYDAADNCDATASIACQITVASSEPEDETGDGRTAPDARVVDSHHVRLRAERRGDGDGRTYTIRIACTDASANFSTASVTVAVPHDR